RSMAVPSRVVPKSWWVRLIDRLLLAELHAAYRECDPSCQSPGRRSPSYQRQILLAIRRRDRDHQHLSIDAASIAGAERDPGCAWHGRRAAERRARERQTGGQRCGRKADRCAARGSDRVAEGLADLGAGRERTGDLWRRRWRWQRALRHHERLAS